MPLRADNRTINRRELLGSSLAAAAVAAGIAPASAEASQVRIVQTYGLIFLPTYVVIDQALIEKHAKARGLGAVSVQFQRVSSGPVASDLLLSGNVDIAMGGFVPLMTLWDKTQETVKGMMGLSVSNLFLFTVDPRIKSIRDYGPDDRIAMTDIKSTNQAMLLEMASAKAFGWDQRFKLDPNMVSMSNGDATAAMLSGKTEVKSHISILPFTAIERAAPGIRQIFSSEDVVHGPITTSCAFTTTRFHDGNPRLYGAIVDAFEEAMGFIAHQSQAAAAIFQKFEPQKAGVASVERMLADTGDDRIQFTSTPHSIGPFAEFMYRNGTLKHHAASWKDFFFENVANKRGS